MLDLYEFLFYRHAEQWSATGVPDDMQSALDAMWFMMTPSQRVHADDVWTVLLYVPHARVRSLILRWLAMGHSPRQISEAEGWTQAAHDLKLRPTVLAMCTAHPDLVQAVRGGGSLAPLVLAVQQELHGRANPSRVRSLIDICLTHAPEMAGETSKATA